MKNQQFIIIGLEEKSFNEIHPEMYHRTKNEVFH